MKIFGLTGGIGSGKSTVSRYWHDHRNLPIIDADIIARNIVEPKTKCLEELVNNFGEGILLATGFLNRKKLAKIVFGNPEKLARLNLIMAPYIANAYQEKVSHIKDEGYKIACYDAALIVESKSTQQYKPLVIVHTEKFLQIERVMKRNTMTEEEVKQRIDSQVSDYNGVGDYLIENNSSLDELYRRADEVLDEIFERF